MWVGAASGAVASLATMPMDVIKTRWMVSPERYEGLADVVTQTYRSEGAASFFKGVRRSSRARPLGPAALLQRETR